MLALARLLFDTMNHCERGTGSEYWGQHGCIQRPRKGRRGEKRTADWSQPGQEPLLHQGTNPTMANVCREKRFASHQPSAPSVARTAFVLVNGDWEDSSSQDEATGLLGRRLGRRKNLVSREGARGSTACRSRPEAHLFLSACSQLSLFRDLQRSTGD